MSFWFPFDFKVDPLPKFKPTFPFLLPPSPFPCHIGLFYIYNCIIVTGFLCCNTEMMSFLWLFCTCMGFHMYV